MGKYTEMVGFNFNKPVKMPVFMGKNRQGGGATECYKGVVYSVKENN